MKKNEILKIYGTQYKNMTKRLLSEAGLADDIGCSLSEKPDSKGSNTFIDGISNNKADNGDAVIHSTTKKSQRPVIGIKPNLVSASEASFGATTHTEIIAGIIEYLRENGDYDIRIMEGAWVGDETSLCFEVCGYNELAEEYGIPLIDTQKDGHRMVDCKGMELGICESAFGVDYLINVPVLKGHCQTKITCALKNMKGLIPNAEKRRYHTMGLHKPIAHLNTGIRQDFIVVDHICGDLDFEDGGNPVTRNCIMAAKDPVLMDSYVCRLLGYETDDVPYVGLAEELGVGSADLSRARVAVFDSFISSANINDGHFVPLPADSICDEEVPDTRRLLEVNDVVNEVDSCSACYGYLIPALDRMKNEGILDGLRESLPTGSKLCIGQGYRGKSGCIGIGNCTSGFDFCVKGCPPTEEEIYRELVRYCE